MWASTDNTESKEMQSDEDKNIHRDKGQSVSKQLRHNSTDTFSVELWAQAGIWRNQGGEKSN